MAKDIFERMAELTAKESLTLAEIEELCIEDAPAKSSVAVIDDVIKYSGLTKDVGDLTKFKLPNTKETWIAITQSINTEIVLSRLDDNDYLNLTNVSEVIGIKSQDILDFLVLRGYIHKLENGEYESTVLGYAKEVIELRDGKTRLTQKGVKRLIAAFDVE